jgi:prophage maintenance system killer protein
VRPLDAADVVVIAGQALGIGTVAALAQVDVSAAQAALATAEGARQEPAAGGSDSVAAAAACIRLVHALLSHRVFPRDGQQVAVAAGLQFLSLNGWQANLEPPATAAVVVEALASGQLAPDAVAAWLAPRLSQARPARPAQVRAARRAAAPRLRPASRVPGRRLAATVLLTVTLTGVGAFAAACSSAPARPAAPASRAPAASATCAHSPGAGHRPGARGLPGHC